MQGLTERQKGVLDFCRAYLAANDQMPTTRIICARFRWRSSSGAGVHLRALERKGALERNEAGNLRFRRGEA